MGRRRTESTGSIGFIGNFVPQDLLLMKNIPFERSIQSSRAEKILYKIYKRIGLVIQDNENYNFVFCAVVEIASNSTLSKVGSACSTDQTHAIERAIYEYIQAILLQNSELTEADKDHADFLKSQTKLIPLINFNGIEKFPNLSIDLLNKKIVSYNEIYFNLKRKNLIDLDVYTIFYKIFWNCLYGYICQCYISNTSKFNLIRQSNVVIPVELFNN